MRLGGKRPAIFFASLVLLCGLLAGCGGGGSEDGSGGGSQNGGGGQNAQGGNAPETKVAIGTVKRLNEENRRFAIRAATGENQDPKPMTFKIRKTADITLGGQKAEVGDIAQDQQAQVEYVVENEVNKAVSVKLFKAGENPQGEQGG